MKIALTYAAMISFTVTANLLLKTGAVSVDPTQGPLAYLLNWRILLGLLSFGLAACFYILILHWLPLNVAQSYTAVQFVAVILASTWILAEPIGTSQWIGISLIAVGISMVGWSQY